MSSSPTHRTPAKTTPFSTTSGGIGGGQGGGATRSQQQRSATTLSIRKAKRNATLAKKRMLVVNNPQVVNNPYSKDSNHVKDTISIATSIVQICSNTNTLLEGASSLSDMLDRLCILITPNDKEDTAITVGVAANSILSSILQLLEGNINLAFELSTSLSTILSTNNFNESIKIKAVVVLNQLAATDPPPGIDSSSLEQYSPYATTSSPQSSKVEIPTSWCYVLVKSGSLNQLVSLLNDNNVSSVELSTKVIGVIGNLAGDSELARSKLYELNTLPLLMKCLLAGLDIIQQQHQQQQSSTSNEGIIDLIRNAIWSITNLIREKTYGACDLLDMVQQHDSSNNDGCDFLDDEQMSGLGIQPANDKKKLNSNHFQMLLSLLELSSSRGINNDMNTSTKETTTTTWNDVAIETCWLLSFLTRDSMAIDYLVEDNNMSSNNNSSQFISALVTRLVLDTTSASQQLKVTCRNDLENAESVIPCCKVLKNIALAADGQYINLILDVIPSGNDTRDVEWALYELISFGTLGAGNSIDAIAIEAAATTGAILYDAGLPQPNPATVACKTLLPALCRGLVCPTSTFDYKREVAWAIWNAIYFPPALYDSRDFVNFPHVNSEIVEIIQNALLEYLLSTARASDVGTSLIDLVTTNDRDAMEASLNIINILLERFGNPTSASTSLIGHGLIVVFDEAGLTDALWGVCNQDSDESIVAELAAEILDKYYDKEDEEDEDEDNMLQPSSTGNQFHFGVQQQTGIDYISPSMPPAGRGRGKVIPAWMQNNN